MTKITIGGKIVIGIILFALVLKTQQTTAFFSEDNQTNDQVDLALSSTSPKLLDLSLTPHEPIEILNDNNFTDYGFLGLGTAEEPYNIENYNITVTNSRGIYINCTTKHFVIRNCYVDTKNDSIYISNVAEGTASIINNTVKNNVIGIWLDSSPGATLTNNIFSNNSFGIILYYSSGATLTNNTLTNNIFSYTSVGIYSYSSSDATLTNNICCNNNVGIL